MNIKNFVPTYARFSFGQVRGLTPTKSSDSEYVTESESESEGKNDTSNLLFNQTWSTSESETESSLDSEDKAIMRERMKKEGIIISDDSSLDSEDMEFLRENTNIEDYIKGRSSWKCPELNTNTFCWICNSDVGTKPGSNCDNSACCEHGRGNDDTSGEETESEMDIEKNLVQDNQGKWHICVTESAEDATIHKLERMYHFQLRMLETSVKQAQADVDSLIKTVNQDEQGATARVGETQSKQGTKYPVLIRWEHGGYLHQEELVNQPYLDLRSLSSDETINMTRSQIKNWIAYREGVEQGINDKNRMEMKQIAESLRNRLYDIIKNVLPNDEKEMRLRFRLKKSLRDTLEHISRLPGIGREVDDLLNIHPRPTALSKDAIRRIYLIIAEFTRDVPTRWVYIRRDYRLENEEEPQPGAGGRVVKNADVKIVKSSCKNPCHNTYDASGNCFLNKNPNKVETAEPFSTDREDDFGKTGPSSTSTPKEAPKETSNDKPHAGQGLAGPKQTIIRHARGYHNKDPTKHSPPDPAKAQMIKKCMEKMQKDQNRTRIKISGYETRTDSSN